MDRSILDNSTSVILNVVPVNHRWSTWNF